MRHFWQFSRKSPKVHEIIIIFFLLNFNSFQLLPSVATDDGKYLPCCFIKFKLWDPGEESCWATRQAKGISFVLWLNFFLVNFCHTSRGNFYHGSIELLSIGFRVILLHRLKELFRHFKFPTHLSVAISSDRLSKCYQKHNLLFMLKCIGPHEALWGASLKSAARRQNCSLRANNTASYIG